MVDAQSKLSRFRFAVHHLSVSETKVFNHPVVTPAVGCRQHHILWNIVAVGVPIFQAFGVAVEQNPTVEVCQSNPRLEIILVEEITRNVHPNNPGVRWNRIVQPEVHHVGVVAVCLQDVEIVLAEIVHVGVLSLLTCRETTELRFRAILD